MTTYNETYTLWMERLRDENPDEYRKARALGIDKPLRDDDPRDVSPMSYETQMWRADRSANDDHEESETEELPEWCRLLLDLIEIRHPVLSAALILRACSHPQAPTNEQLFAPTSRVTRQKAAAHWRTLRTMPWVITSDDFPFTREQIVRLEVLAWCIGRPWPKMSMWALLRAAGVQAAGNLTLETLAALFGCTKQNMQREVAIAQTKFRLRRNQFQRTEEHAAIYRYTNSVNKQ